MFLRRYQNLYRFKAYFARYKGLIGVLLCCMLTASSMGVLLSYLSSQQMIAITDVSVTGMAWFAALILGTVLIHHTTWFLWDRISAIIGSRVARDIRGDILAGTLSMKYRAIRENATGYYLERLNEDAGEVSYFVQNVLGTLVDVLTNVSFLVIIYVQNWQCALLFTLGLVGLYLIDLAKIRVELRHTERIKVLSEAMDSRMTEVIRGVRDIKGLGVKDEVLRRNGEISEQLSVQSARMKSDVALLERARTFGQWLIDALLILLCALWLFPTGQITVVVLLIILNYKGLMYDTVGFFSRLKGYYVQGDYRAGRILEVIDGRSSERFGARRLDDSTGTIDVRNLSFAYNGEEVLHDVSFSLAPRTASVLLGPSGSGKSTLFGLLTKLNDVPDGHIFINGFDINALTQESITSHIGIVNQEPFLFGDTILNNLKLVKPVADEAELREACRRANILDEILAMKDGFQTMLSENGGNLSGGQRQRLSIARAILKDTPIILFDEPTSALDGENHARFLATIDELKADKTLFVIAHRLNDLDRFDNVWELRTGRALPCTRSRG